MTDTELARRCSEVLARKVSAAILRVLMRTALGMPSRPWAKIRLYPSEVQ